MLLMCKAISLLLHFERTFILHVFSTISVDSSYYEGEP